MHLSRERAARSLLDLSGKHPAQPITEVAFRDRSAGKLMRYFECLRSRSAPRRRDHRWSSQCERQYAAPAQTHGYLPYLSFIVLIASGYGTAQSDICQNTRTGLGGMATA